jgi:hypothetical protein
MDTRKILACSMSFALLGVSVTMSGCQTTVGGQTLPSAHYLQDDVQYFPAYSEDLLPKQREALKQYAIEQNAAK